MTLGWFWCFGWYHNVQLTLVLQAYLTHLTQESSSLPSDHTCFFAVCNSSCPHPGAARQDQELWILLIFMSDLEKSTEALFLRVEFKESRGGGEGFSEFLTLVPVSFLDTSCLTIACWHTSPLLLVFCLACFSPALVTRTTLGTSRVSFIIITNKNFFCLILKTSLINFAHDTCYFFSPSFIFFLVAH